MSVKGPADWAVLLAPKMTSPNERFGELGLVIVHQFAKEGVGVAMIRRQGKLTQPFM